MLIITDNTTLTNYNVTGLNNNTVYHVSVTASNNAGSSNSANMSTMTNGNGKYIRHYRMIKSPLVFCPYMCKFSIQYTYGFCLSCVHYCM